MLIFPVSYEMCVYVIVHMLIIRKFLSDLKEPSDNKTLGTDKC